MLLKQLKQLKQKIKANIFDFKKYKEYNGNTNDITLKTATDNFNEVKYLYKIMDILDKYLIINKHNVGTTSNIQMLIDQKDNFIHSFEKMKFIKE